MRILTFILFLIPVFAFAQYPANPNKIRLGYQTTADGLIWRGVAADTANTPTGYKQYAYVVLDTVNVALYGFIQSAGRWQRIGDGVGVDSLKLLNDVNTTGATAGSVLKLNSAGVWVDSTDLQGIVAADTAAMLSKYIERGDTATMLAPFLDGGGTANYAAYWSASKTLTGSNQFKFTPGGTVNFAKLGATTGTTFGAGLILSGSQNGAGAIGNGKTLNYGETGFAGVDSYTGKASLIQFVEDQIYLRSFANASLSAQEIGRLSYTGNSLGGTSTAYTLSLEGTSVGLRLTPHDNALTGVEGLIYADNSENIPKYYNGATWRNFAFTDEALTGSGANNRMAIWSGTLTQTSDARLSYSLGSGATSTYYRIGGQGTLSNGTGLILNGIPSGTAFISNGRAINELESAFVGAPTSTLGAFAFQFVGDELWFRRWNAGSNSHIDVARFTSGKFTIGGTAAQYTLSTPNTDAYGIPRGTTDQRPRVVTASGQPLRYNTDSTRYEGYNGSAWKTLAWKTDATGGSWLTGSGSANHVAYWSSSTGLTFDNGQFYWDPTNNRLGLGNTVPQRTLHVTGEARISDLTTDTPTLIVGADSDGDLGAITVGSGLSLSAGTLSVTSSSVTGSGSANHIAYWDSGTNLTYDASQLYWDATNNRLGIGNAAPSVSLHVTGEARITDLVNGTPTALVGYDVNGNLGTMVTGLGIAVSSGSIVTDFSEYSTVTPDSADFFVFRDVSASIDRKAKPVDAIKAADGHIYASNSSVNLISTGLFTDNREVFIWATLTSAAANNATFTIPDPSATYLGRKIYVASDDDSGTYKIIIATANPGGFYYSPDLVAAPSAQDTFDMDAFPGFSTIFVCMQKSTSYYWVPIFQ